MLPAALLPLLTDDNAKTYPRSLPEGIDVTVTPLFNRIAVQLTEQETIVSGAAVEGHVDIRKNGVWHNGTELYRSYGTDDYYANCFNLIENTRYKTRLVVRFRDTTTQEVVKQYVHYFAATTRSSATPQSDEMLWYVNPGVTSAGNGLSPSTPFKWLNQRDGGWQPGDTIVIMNGDFSGASTTQRVIDGAEGSATNWIRIVPYSAVEHEPGDPAEDLEKETFRSVVDLDGPWTDETSARSGVHAGMPGVWSMLLPNNRRLLGHVREVSSGLELYPHNTFSRAVSTGEPGIKEGWASVAEAKFPDFEPNGPGGFFVDLEHSETVSSQTYWRLYVRTVDGDEPDEGQYIGGYWTGPTIRNCSYLSIEGCAFDGLQNITKTSGSYWTTQTLSKNGTVSDGTYTLKIGNETTSPIDHDADNAAILAALVGLSNIAPGDVELGGGGLPGTAVTFTFRGNYTGVYAPEIIVNSGNLEGGGSYQISSTTGVNRIGSNGAITLSATGGTDCHDVYIKKCSFKNTYLRFSGTFSPMSRVKNVLVDDCVFHRDGPTEYFFDQREYTESDPYESLYGYHPIKASIWDGHGQAIFNHANRGQAVVIRNSTFRAYDIYSNPDASNSREEGKHLDIYGCTSTGIGLADANWSDGPSAVASVNAAIWDCVLDDHAEPLAASPINGGPIWMFACRGDGFLHIPYKLGIQSTAAGYDTDNGHGFKIIANTSFAGVGFTNSPSIGNQRWQGCYSGLLGCNNVVKGYQAVDGDTPLSPWFSYSDEFTGGHEVKSDRVNVWCNGVIYIVNASAASGDAARPKLRWGINTYDPMHPTSPTYPLSEEKIVWEDYIFGWSYNEDDDPFPTSTADGLNSAITRKSVYVRGITDLAGDEEGDPVALVDLPIGCFPLRAAE